MTGTLDRDTGRDEPVRRPHVWPCRHCDMVGDYRLNRENEIQLAEGRFRQDEDYRLTTFKRWLQTFEWDSVRDRTQHGRPPASTADDHGADENGPDPWAEHRTTRWAEDEQAAGGPDPVQRARAVLLALPDPRSAEHDALTDERAEQLARWHTRDHPDEHDADTGADVYDRSA